MVNVKTGRKESGIRQNGDSYEANVKSQPVDGKANEEVIQILAKFFEVKKSKIRILTGFTSRKKLIQVDL